MVGGFCAHSSPSRSSPRSSTHCLASKNIIQHSRDQKSPSWRTRTTTNFNKVRWRLLLSTPNIYTTCIHTFHPNPSVSPRRPSWCILPTFVVTKLDSGTQSRIFCRILSSRNLSPRRRPPFSIESLQYSGKKLACLSRRCSDYQSGSVGSVLLHRFS